MINPIYSSRTCDNWRECFIEKLDRAEKENFALSFFWRDDDAIELSEQLRALIQIQEDFSLPLFLSVIPAHVQPNLLNILHDDLFIVQHGWQHLNHEPPGHLKSEFGPGRRIESALDEIKRGRDILIDLFGSSFCPFFVPPWNRITSQIIHHLPDLSFRGLSAYRRRTTSFYQPSNTQLDIIGWKFSRSFIGQDRAYRRLCVELERRRRGHVEPIGILTHHLVHDQSMNSYLIDLFSILQNYSNINWVRFSS